MGTIIPRSLWFVPPPAWCWDPEVDGDWLNLAVATGPSNLWRLERETKERQRRSVAKKRKLSHSNGLPKIGLVQEPSARLVETRPKQARTLTKSADCMNRILTETVKQHSFLIYPMNGVEEWVPDIVNVNVRCEILWEPTPCCVQVKPAPMGRPGYLTAPGGTSARPDWSKSARLSR